MTAAADNDDGGARNRELLLAANEEAARFYRSQLLQPSSAGQRTYLSRRGFGELLAASTSWTVGYAPGGWTSLVDHLRHNHYSDQALLAAGLACRTRRNTLIDRFRDRITFGVRDTHGQLVGFTARCGPSAPATVPKYLNTPTTAVYRKGEVPFGLGEQHTRIQGGAVPVLVEGPLDALAVHLAQDGQEDDFAGLALCGTALSPALSTHLTRLNAQRVVLAFDSDDAGTRATERAVRALVPALADVRAVNTHGTGDPADVFTRSGGPSLVGELRGAGHASDQVLDAHLRKWAGRLDHVEAKVGCLREAATLLAELPPGDTAHHVVRLATGLGIGVDAVTAELVECVSHASASARDPGPRRREIDRRSRVVPIDRSSDGRGRR